MLATLYACTPPHPGERSAWGTDRPSTTAARSKRICHRLTESMPTSAHWGKIQATIKQRTTQRSTALYEWQRVGLALAGVKVRLHFRRKGERLDGPIRSSFSSKAFTA